MGGGVSYLDAGHGGYDPGASYFGISEKSLTLAIQSRVKAKLEAEGYQVVTTRTSDTYVDLTDRSRAANASESDIFVSIHINASGSSASIFCKIAPNSQLSIKTFLALPVYFSFSNCTLPI